MLVWSTTCVYPQHYYYYTLAAIQLFLGLIRYQYHCTMKKSVAASVFSREAKHARDSQRLLLHKTPIQYHKSSLHERIISCEWTKLCTTTALVQFLRSLLLELHRFKLSNQIRPYEAYLHWNEIEMCLFVTILTIMSGTANSNTVYIICSPQ